MSPFFKFSFLAIAVLVVLLPGQGCKNTGVDHTADSTLFKLLPAEQTGIDFTNTLTDGLNTNVLLYQYYYNGGGVAAGDLNGDGLEDLYFTANMTDNKLYLNTGNMHFKDVTDIAQVAGRPGPWKTGVTFVDINGDNKLDIFVCYSGHLRPEKRVNQLFINQGNDAEGVPHFKEMAADYGLDFPSYSTQAYFFDYDRDGDLDLLLVNHNPARLSIPDAEAVATMLKQPDTQAGIRLLRNDGGKFKDVTGNSGIVNTTMSYGLAAGISDINGDGWPDIYISNDYSVPDRLYINNGNGTFTDKLEEQMGHTSLSSMGTEIADINNDLRPDIYTLDMLPEDNHRQKLMFGEDNRETFDLNVRSGLYYQYMRNMLQLNNGDNTFSEIGQQAGISATDWSWAPLFADYDNDGWKDLFITNGYTRDYTNLDFLKLMNDRLQNRRVMRQDLLDLVKEIPLTDVKSYLFKNQGGASFGNVSTQWGIEQPSNSNGAVYTDLNNDGNLDLVVNNVNKPAFIYQNRAVAINKNHFLEVKLAGADQNTQGIGAKLILYCHGKKQYLEQMPARGFQSTVSPVAHFGLGADKKVDSLRVIWQRGKTQLISSIKADQRITLEEKNAHEVYHQAAAPRPLFEQSTSPIKDDFALDKTDDYKRQSLLINPLSFPGPCMAKADVNGDGLEDVYVGGGAGRPGKLFLQQAGGRFLPIIEPDFNADQQSTDAAAVFFDANHDGKPDLYVCSGGYGDYKPNDARLQDRLYLNDGKGHFKRSSSALPAMLSSKGCVSVADVNGDGFPDLFVGGRAIPGRYPETPESYLLINDGKGHFTDQAERYNAALKTIGMVTCAVWADMNGDGKPDLIVAGEWMPVTVFENTGNRLVDATAKYLDRSYHGMWNTLTVTDLNKDGHPDIIAGNLGLNSQIKASDQEPAALYYSDFDHNGTIDPILCFYIQHQSYPYVTRDQLIEQLPGMRPKFPDYKSYADATISDVFSPQQLSGAHHLAVNCLQTMCLISNKTGKLKPVQLPPQAQYSPVFTITCLDYDHDGNTDLLLCGNINRAGVHFGKYDANYGVLLKGNGKGSFNYVDQSQSGFHIKGDVRSVIDVSDQYLFSINGQGVISYRYARSKTAK